MKDRYTKFVFESEDGTIFRYDAENGMVWDVSEGKEGELIVKALKVATSDIYSDNYVNPPIPKGYQYVEGKWNKGFVIERVSDGSQFVWIPVGSLDYNGILDPRRPEEKFGRRNYRGNISTFAKWGFHEELDGEFAYQLESVQKYGGFYISRYNISRGNDGKPHSVRGVMSWVNINFYDAKNVAAAMEDGEVVKSHLTYGAEYDSVLEWLIKSRAKTPREIAKDSTAWGNYRNTLAETGSCEAWCANNIYDFAGNVEEWTQERNADMYRVSRGGSYKSDGIATPAAYRQSNNPYEFYSYLGFRVVLYIK